MIEFSHERDIKIFYLNHSIISFIGLLKFFDKFVKIFEFFYGGFHDWTKGNFVLKNKKMQEEIDTSERVKKNLPFYGLLINLR